MKKIKHRLKKAWLKYLKASCNRKWDKARQLHAKIIGLELEIKVLENSDGKLN